LQVLVPARGPAELPDAATPNKYLSEPALDRLACNPVITPVLLDSDGGLLDLGRSQRLFTATQHKALALRDAGCRFPGCNRPPAHTDAHHISPWADGGPTTMQNGLLLCRYHHRKVHQEGWTISTTSSGGDGSVTFTNPHTGSQHTTSPRGP
jgi:hypothetical protein